MSDTALTPRQKQIYDLVESACLDGVPPTVRELMDATGIRSPNGITCHLRALKKKGRIEMDAAKARNIRLVEGKVRVSRTGSWVFVSTSGPVAFTRDEWRAWLNEQVAT
jgi:repressor LexA